MRILVTGDRNWQDVGFIHRVLNKYLEKHKDKLFIIQGGARGVDWIALNWALGKKVDFVTRWAHWGSHGVAAGPVRNHLMHDEHKPDLVIAFHPDLFGESRGTYEMYTYARRNGTRVLHFMGKENLDEWNA